MGTLKVRAAALAALAATTVLTGCASSGGSTGNSGASGDGAAGVAHATAQVAAAEAAITTYSQPGGAVSDAARLRGKTVYFIPIGLKIALFQNTATAMKTALGHLGISVQACDGEFTPSGISACMNQALNNHAAAVVTMAIPYALTSTSYDALEKAGIPTYLADSETGGQAATRLRAFGDPDPLQSRINQLEADTIIATSGGKANVLFLKLADSTTTTVGSNAGLAEFAQYCPGCTVTSVQTTTATVSQTPATVSAALVAHPKIDYIYVSGDPNVPAVLQGAQSAGVALKVKAAGYVGALDALQRIKSGRFQFATVGYSANYLGWSFSDAAVRMLLGTAPPTDYPIVARIFDETNVGGLTLTAADEATNDWYGSSSFQNAYLQSWGAS